MKRAAALMNTRFTFLNAEYRQMKYRLSGLKLD